MRLKELAEPAPALTDIPLPVASVPAAQVPACPDCGVELNAANGSRLPSGVCKHIGCPMASAPAPSPAPTTSEAPKRRGRPPGAKNKQKDEVPSAGGETCNVCGELGAQTLTASEIQVHNGCKGAKDAASPAEIRVDLKLPETGRVQCAEPNPPSNMSATLAPTSAETTVTAPEPVIGERGVTHDFLEALQDDGRKRAAEKWNSGGMDGDGPRVHPLAGTLRIELGLSPELVSLAERLIAALVMRS